MSLGAAISAGASLLGGFLNRGAAKDANAQQAALAQQNIKLQKDFAQHGIRWKVKDAKAAGIHPLYALGAQTTSFSPVTAGSTADTSLGSAVASMGQDISRSMHATRTGSERDAAFVKTVQDLELQRGGLQNELLATQIAKMKGQIGPPMPSIAPDADFPVPENKKPDERPPLMMFGKRWMTNPNTSPMKAFEDQYGDEGPLTWPMQAAIMTNDVFFNAARALRWFNRNYLPKPSRVRSGGSGW